MFRQETVQSGVILLDYQGGHTLIMHDGDRFLEQQGGFDNKDSRVHNLPQEAIFPR